MGIDMSNFVKQVLTPVIGFGLAGALWGHSIFVGEVKLQNDYGTPFPYILGAIFFGILGAGALTIFSRGWKKIMLTICITTMIWVIGFTVPRIWEEDLSFWGTLILALPIGIVGFFNTSLARSFLEPLQYLGLQPKMALATFWPEFLLIAIAVTAAYALALKANIKRLVIFGTVGFTVSSIVSPVIGNLVGNLFNSLFAVYLITFTLIGVMFGSALVWGLRGNAEET